MKKYILPTIVDDWSGVLDVILMLYTVVELYRQQIKLWVCTWFGGLAFAQLR